MANASISYNNILQRTGVTVTESTALAGAGNLATQRLHSLWRASGNTASIKVDAQSSVTARVLWMGAANFTSNCTIRIRASNSAFGNTDQLDTGTVAADISTDWLTLIHFLDSDVTARYWQIDLDDSGVTRLEAGAMHIGPIIRPSINIDFGYSIKLIDPSVKRTSIGQQPFRIVRPKYRQATLTWKWLSESEAVNDLFNTVDRLSGMTQNVLFILDEDGSYLHENAVWGPLSDLSPAERARAGTEGYRKRYRVDEVPPTTRV